MLPDFALLLLYSVLNFNDFIIELINLFIFRPDIRKQFSRKLPNL